MSVVEQEKNIFSMRGVNFLPQDIEQGLDFMLAHFEEPIWPRNVSTAATQDRQKVLYDRDRAILYYRGALRADCKIAIYSNYEELAKNGRLPLGYKPKPCHLFIDLDLASFDGDKDRLDLALKGTLKNIKQQLNGAAPTVLWSGGGYHVHQPLDPNEIPVYEELPEFKRHNKDPSVQFMRYAEQVLTCGKADRNHKVSFASCMARIPGSYNSKYEDNKDVREVRIVQCWDGVRARPRPRFMLADYLIWLVQTESDAKERMREQAKKFAASRSNLSPGQGIAWIDRLLQTPMRDYRKTVIALILAPYLVTVRRMSYDQAYDVITHWLAECARLNPLQPNKRAFDARVHMSLSRSHRLQMRPLRLATLLQNYPMTYNETLSSREVHEAK